MKNGQYYRKVSQKSVLDQTDLFEELGILEFCEALLASGLTSAFDRAQIIYRDSARAYVQFSRVQGFALSEPLPGAKPPPPKPPRFGRCKIYPFTDCISLRCQEDGFCRQSGEEIVTAC